MQNAPTEGISWSLSMHLTVEVVAFPENVWHERCLQQSSHNQQLGKQLAQLERRLEELGGQHTSG